MPISADNKDWTWVLDRRCNDCGFDPVGVTEHDVVAMIRGNAAAWPAVLHRTEVAVRPNDSTWSLLEYAAHVRDVFRIGSVRCELMLTANNPLFANWNQDVTAESERYNEQNPAAVAAELVDAGLALAETLAALPEESWARRGRRSDGATFTVSSFAKYVAHDVQHHLWDVRPL